jgi:hypothetical protein
VKIPAWERENFRLNKGNIFPSRKSLVSDIPSGEGKTANPFFTVYWHRAIGSSTMQGSTIVSQARTQRPQARVLAQSDSILNYAEANYSVTGKDTEAAG